MAITVVEKLLFPIVSSIFTAIDWDLCPWYNQSQKAFRLPLKLLTRVMLQCGASKIAKLVNITPIINYGL